MSKDSSTKLGLGLGTHISSWEARKVQPLAKQKPSRFATGRQQHTIIMQQRALALLCKTGRAAREMDSKWKKQQLLVHPANTQKQVQVMEGGTGSHAFCMMCTAADTGKSDVVG